MVSVGSHGHFSGFLGELLGILRDRIIVTDAILRTLCRNRLDSFDLSDNFIIGFREVFRLLADPFALNDARLRDLVRQFANNLDTDDARLRDLARLLSESLDPNDEQIKEMFRNVGERIVVTDQLTILKDLSRLFANNIVLTDFFTSERIRAQFLERIEEVIVLFGLVSTANTIIADMVDQGVEFRDLETSLQQLEEVSGASALISPETGINTEIKTVEEILNGQQLQETATALFKEEKDPASALFKLWEIILEKYTKS